MNEPFSELIESLSFGENKFNNHQNSSFGFVETIAQAYERARNSLEYRADNLVRRAATERILRRMTFLNKGSDDLIKSLLTELKWARYISSEEEKLAISSGLQKILDKYASFSKTDVPKDWIIKIASSEIEELFNLNADYQKFTLFASKVLKEKINTNDPAINLLIFFAVDKAYGGSDDEKIAYHIVKLTSKNITSKSLEEAWRLFNLAKGHKDLSRIIRYVRRQMPPLVLLRDMYFSDPSEFKNRVSDEKVFKQVASEVLSEELSHMSRKIARAGVRSVLYVFLTKMILAFVIEVPFEILFFGRLKPLPFVINMVFPPVIMWLTTTQIKTPNLKSQELLIERSWYVLNNFEALSKEDDVLGNAPEKDVGSIGYTIFSILYAIFFVGVFVAIVYLLNLIGFSPFSILIFIFFLSIIAFFAYRISQIAKSYDWNEIGVEKSSTITTLSLPILTIGSKLSQGLTKLNFLAVTFDFILEAPFKIILGFVDSWIHFIKTKREEQILE